MQNFEIRPSAYTYGLYNKSIVDAKWPMAQQPTSTAKPVETGSSTAINSSGTPSDGTSTPDLTRIHVGNDDPLSSSAGLMQSSASAPVTKTLTPHRAVSTSSGALDNANAAERKNSMPPMHSEQRDANTGAFPSSTLTSSLLRQQSSVRERHTSGAGGRPKSGGFLHHAISKPIVKGDVSAIPTLKRQISNSTMRRVEQQVGILIQLSSGHHSALQSHKHRSFPAKDIATVQAVADENLVTGLQSLSSEYPPQVAQVSPSPQDLATPPAAPAASAISEVPANTIKQTDGPQNGSPRSPKVPPPRPPPPKQGFQAAASSPSPSRQQLSANASTTSMSNVLREHSDLHPSYLSQLPTKPPTEPTQIQTINPLNAPAAPDPGESVTRSILNNTLVPTFSRLTSQLSGSFSLMQKQAANIMKPLYNQSRPYRPARRFSRRLPTPHKPGTLAEEQDVTIEKETGSNSPAGTSDDNDIEESEGASDIEGFSDDEAASPDVEDSWENELEPLAPQLPSNSRQSDLFTAPLPQLLTTKLWEQKKFSTFIAQRQVVGPQYSGSAVSTPTNYSKVLGNSRSSQKQRLSTAHSMPLLDSGDENALLESSAHLNSFNPNSSQPVEPTDSMNRTTSLQNVSQAPALQFRGSSLCPNAEQADNSPLDAVSASSEQAAAQAKSIESLQSTQNAQSPYLLVHMCTMTHCGHCGVPVYDEEIQAGWRPADSNLNCICPFCKSTFVPQLHIYVRDQRDHCSEASLESTTTSVNPSVTTCDSRLSQDIVLRAASSASNSSAFSFETLPSVPYLSPIVLRKEIESVLRQEGDRAFLALDFVDNHRAVYWNLLYYIKRSELLTFLPALILFSKHFSDNKVLSISAADSNANINVASSTTTSSSFSQSLSGVPTAQNLLVLTDRIHVQLLWDDIHAALSRNETPLYYLWKSSMPPSTICLWIIQYCISYRFSTTQFHYIYFRREQLCDFQFALRRGLHQSLLFRRVRFFSLELISTLFL